MRLKRVFILIIGLNLTLFATAQVNVTGTVTDNVSGETIYGAVIKVDGIGKARTDFDGLFSLELGVGTYELTLTNTSEGYLDQKISVVVQKDNPIDLKIEIAKSKAVQEIDEIEIVAVQSIGTPKTEEGGDLARLDEIGSSEQLTEEAIKRTGVSDAAAAVGKTPGASVEDGKNIYIRGLGDRYVKTTLNGMEIPGLDPDKNSVQLDIFPAILIENITVYKTFTPNLIAEFTGGLVNITTKEFPGRKTLYVKAGLGYNTNASLNSDFISYQGGKLDFLGMDDGSRGLSLNPNQAILNPVVGSQLTEAATRSFSSTMAAEKASSFLDQNYAFAYGDQKTFNKKKDNGLKYGYNFVLNYRTANKYFADVEYNEYLRDPDVDQTSLFRDRTSRGEQATKDVLWTALFSQSIKKGRNKLSLVLFHTQNGTSSAAKLIEKNYDSNQAVLAKEGLQYTQRSVTNANLSGLHFLDSAAAWKLSWKISPTISSISDPDIRSTALEVSEAKGPLGETLYLFEESVGAEVRRIFRGLKEVNLSSRFDLDYKFNLWDSLESIVSFGGLTTYKSRSFDVSEYVFRLYGMSNNVPNDPDWFFEAENIWTPESNQGTYATGQQEKANIYEANQMINSGYVMHQLPFSQKFSATYGARVERSANRYTGQSSNADFDPSEPRYNNEVVLEGINVLPSINMVYKLRKGKDSLREAINSNIRGAYTQTVARPSFREISISQIYDPIQGRRYLGNIDLKQTLIHNADLRWERFFGRTELVSASMFYKKFINPIEVVANVAAPNEFMPVNAGEANMYGAEVELRKTIGFNRPSKEHIRFVLGANFTYVQTFIDMNKIETTVGGVTMTEKEVREANARTGEVIGDYRSMYGQSPYAINAFLNFKNDSLNLMCNVSYNVQGKKLSVIGLGSVPDVYAQPFHNLSFKVTKGFGKCHSNELIPRWSASLKGQNLLNFARVRLYEAYNAESQVFDSFHQGMTISGSIAFTIR